MAQVFSFDGHLALTATATPIGAQSFHVPLENYPTSTTSLDFYELWQTQLGFSNIEELYSSHLAAQGTTPTSLLTPEWLQYLPHAELVILEEDQLFELVQRLQLLDARSLVYLHDWSNYVDQCLLLQLMPFFLSAKFAHHLVAPRLQQIRSFLDSTVPPLKWQVKPPRVTRSQLYSEIEHLWQHADPEMRKHLEASFTRELEFKIEEQDNGTRTPSLLTFKLHLDSLCDLQQLERANHAALQAELQRYRSHIAQGLKIGPAILGDFSQLTREDVLRNASQHLRDCWANMDATLAQLGNEAGTATSNDTPSELVPKTAKTANTTTRGVAQLAKNFYQAASQLESWEYLTLLELTAQDQRLLEAHQAWSNFTEATICERIDAHASSPLTSSAELSSSTSTRGTGTSPAQANSSRGFGAADSGASSYASLVQDRADFSRLAVQAPTLAQLRHADPHLQQQLVELTGFQHRPDAKQRQRARDNSEPPTLAQRNQQLRQLIAQQQAEQTTVADNAVAEYRLDANQPQEWQIELCLQSPSRQNPSWDNLMAHPELVNSLAPTWDVTASVLKQSTAPQLRLHQLGAEVRAQLEQLEQLATSKQAGITESASTSAQTGHTQHDHASANQGANSKPSEWASFPHAYTNLALFLPELSPQLYRQLRRYQELPGVVQELSKLSQRTPITYTQFAQAWWNQKQVAYPLPQPVQASYIANSSATSENLAKAKAPAKAQPALAKLLRDQELPLGMLLACHGDLRRLWHWDANTQYDFKHGLFTEPAHNPAGTAGTTSQIPAPLLLERLQATGYPTLAQLLQKEQPQVVAWREIQATSIKELESQAQFPHREWNPAYYQALVGETYALDYRLLYSKSSNPLLSQATVQPYAALVSSLGTEQRQDTAYQQAVAQQIWTSQGRFNLVSYALELLSLILPQAQLVTILPSRGVVMRGARMLDAQNPHIPTTQRWSYIRPISQTTSGVSSFPTEFFVRELVHNLSRGLNLIHAISASLRAVHQGYNKALKLLDAPQVGYLLLDLLVPNTPTQAEQPSGNS